MIRTLGIGALIWCGAWAQSVRPAFQVVSIKPAGDVTAIHIAPKRSGNRLTYVTEARMVLYYAYRVDPFQVVGEMPDGIYEIQAVVDGSPGDDELRLLFRQLLEDRFRLKVHTETRQMAGFELTVAKGGARLKAAQNGGEETMYGTLAPEGVSAFLPKEGPRLVGRNASMKQMAESLGRLLHGPVADRTGLEGRYDFHVAYTRDESGEDLPTAIQRLGLKLQAGKAPVQVLVIDRVSAATEN